MFGAQSTAVGMAEDLRNGLIERFRSLVMARSAVLAGRVLADALLNMFGILLMLGVGYLVGFRLHTDLAALVAATGVLLFGFAISWVNALLGMVAKSAEAAAAASLPLTVLLAFPSSAFLLTGNMPGPLRAYADHQPLSATVNAIRPLLLGGPTASHAVAAIIWCAVTQRSITRSQLVPRKRDGRMQAEENTVAATSGLQTPRRTGARRGRRCCSRAPRAG